MERRMHSIVLFSGALLAVSGLLVVFAAGCQSATGGGGGGDDGDGDEAATPDAVAGQTTFEASCQACHGEPGAGGGVGADLAGIGATDLATGATAETHADVGDVSTDDYADMAAYLAGGGEDDGDDEGDGMDEDDGDDEGGGAADDGDEGDDEDDGGGEDADDGEDDGGGAADGEDDGGGDGVPEGGNAAAGEITYEVNCQYCHGTVGEGDGFASDLAGVGVADLEAGATADTHADVGDLTADDFANLAAFLAG